jgi:Multiubiquitin
MATQVNDTKDKPGKDKYDVNIEGVDHEWETPTITVPQIRELAGWSADQEVIEVNVKDNSERTLGEGETVTLQPGKGFGKKVHFKRG